MNRALVYLTVRRTVNSLKRIPRSPRLLLPVVLFLLILCAQALPYLLAPRRDTERLPPHAAALQAALTAVANSTGAGAMSFGIEALLLASTFASLMGALNEGTLFFDPSDVDHLFPGPFGRRTILLFRMLPLYAMRVFPAVYVPLLVGGTSISIAAGMSPVAYWPGMLAAWLYLIAIANFAQAILLTRWSNPDAETDRTDRRRARLRLVIGSALAVILIGLVLVVAQFLRAEGEAPDLRPLIRIFNSRIATILLAPMHWAAQLFRVAYEGWTPAAAGRAFGLAIFCSLSFVALYSRDRDFFDGATELSARAQRTHAARRGGDSREYISQLARDGKFARGLTLPEFGGGARALLWMEMIAVTRMPLRVWGQLLVVAAVPGLFGLAFPRGDLQVLSAICFFALQISGVFLNGLRGMIGRADLNKTLPISPLLFLPAALATSVALLTVLGWFSLTISALLGSGHGPLLVVAYVIFPSVAALMIAVQTGFVLLYPQPRDAAQNAVGNLVSLFCSILTLAPGMAILLVLDMMKIAPTIVGLAAATVNLVLALAALLADSYLWYRYDPSG